MKNILYILCKHLKPAIVIFFFCSCQDKNTGVAGSVFCSDDCQAKSKSTEMVCKLTDPELSKRKETVLAELKKRVIETRELPNGYAFKFPGTDDVLDQLNEFIKSERECCDFFTFNLSVSGDKSETWLQLTGREGVKDFIVMELGL